AQLRCDPDDDVAAVGRGWSERPIRSAKAVETPQVVNDIGSDTTGTAGRLRRGKIVPSLPGPSGAHRGVLIVVVPLPDFPRSSWHSGQVFVCPRRVMRARTGVAPPETPRSPRGLQRGIVHDLGRLYRLRQAVVVHRSFISASTARD